MLISHSLADLLKGLTELATRDGVPEVLSAPRPDPGSPYASGKQQKRMSPLPSASYKPQLGSAQTGAALTASLQSKSPSCHVVLANWILDRHRTYIPMGQQ
jgi:hypothetical protein